MQKLIQIMVLCLLCSCTYSVSMIHSDQSPGSTDNLEDNQSPSPNISPNLNIPLNKVYYALT
jgi:hypothetical protein